MLSVGSPWLGFGQEALSTPASPLPRVAMAPLHRQEAETRRSEWSLFAPSCPGTRGSFSEAGIRLGQLWWGLLGSAPPLFPGWQMEGHKLGLPAQPPALRPLTPHPSPSSAPHPYCSPIPPGTELQETLSGSSHCSPRRSGSITVLYFRKSLLFSSCCLMLPSPSSTQGGAETETASASIYPVPGAPHQEMPPPPHRPIPGTPLRCTTGFEEGVPQPLTATQVPPASPGVGGGSGRLERKRGGGGEGVGFQARWIEAPPTRWRPRLPFPLLHLPGRSILLPRDCSSPVSQQVLWTNTRSGHNLSASSCWTSASLGSIYPWWPGSPGSSTPTPAALPCEHQPLPSPAMGPFTLATVLCPSDASVWVLPPRQFLISTGSCPSPTEASLTSDSTSPSIPKLLPLCILEPPLPAPSSPLPAAQRSSFAAHRRLLKLKLIK